MTETKLRQTTRAEVIANVEAMRKRGWTMTADPVQLQSGNWVLPEVRVITYDLGKRNIDKHFFCWEQAEKWLLNAGSEIFNVYRSPGSGVGGDWRTDW